MSNVSSSNGLEKYPKLRFKGFSEPWVSTVLSDTFRKNSKKNTDGAITNAICNSAKNGLIPQRDYFDKDIANADNTDGYYIIEKDDFVYNPRKSTEAPYGPVSVYKYTEKGIVSPLYLCFRALHPINADFFDFYFKSFAWHRYIYLAGDSGARHDRVSIRDDVFFAMPISLPSAAEQNKISSLFILIEQRIKAQAALVETLKKYKRGLLQHIMRQNNDWEKVRLSDILFERKTYCEKDGTYEHATLSKEGVYGKTDRYDRDYLVMDDEKKYKITKLGDLCYNPANLKFGVICLNTYGDAIFSPIYITFEIAPNYNKDFIGLLLTRTDFIKRALRYQQGTVYERMAVSPEDLLTMEISVPTLETQNRIAHLFTNLDARIKKNESILEGLQNGKKQLLSSLFV